MMTADVAENAGKLAAGEIAGEREAGGPGAPPPAFLEIPKPEKAWTGPPGKLVCPHFFCGRQEEAWGAHLT